MNLALMTVQQSYKEKLLSLLPKMYFEDSQLNHHAQHVNQIIALTCNQSKRTRPLLSEYYKNLVHFLLTNRPLTVEQMIDLLTINYKDDVVDPEGNDCCRFDIALDLLFSTSNV